MEVLMDNLLLTEREACERLRLGRSTLRRLWAEGAINPVKIGRSLRFPASEVERFVKALQHTAEAQV
jgi:excisionase family DNA binding protein